MISSSLWRASAIFLSFLGNALVHGVTVLVLLLCALLFCSSFKSASAARLVPVLLADDDEPAPFPPFLYFLVVAALPTTMELSLGFFST